MKKLIRGFFIIFVFSNLLFGSNISQENIEKLIELSRLKEQIAQIPENILFLNKHWKKKFSKETYQKINSASLKAFDASKIMSAVRQAIQNNISNAEAKELIGWFRTPAGQEITDAEIMASRPQSYIKAVSNLEQLLNNKKSICNATKIFQILNIERRNIKFERNIFLYEYIILETFVHKKLVTADDLEAKKEQFRTMQKLQKQQSKHSSILFMAYSYKDITDAKMKQYIKFLEQKSTLLFNNIVVDSLYKVIEEGTQSVIDVLYKNDKQLSL